MRVLRDGHHLGVSTATTTPALDIGGWAAVDDHVSGRRRRHLARREHSKRRQQLWRQYHVLSESRHPFSAELDHAEDGEYVRRRIRRGPGRHRLDDE